MSGCLSRMGSKDTTVFYWLTGAIGAGKTTLGAALAASFSYTVFIDGDYLIADPDALPFADRIAATKQALLDKIMQLAQQKQSAVIAYPITSDTAAQIRRIIQDHDAHIVIIGVQPPVSNGTRNYSDWEQKRQIEMVDVSGQGFADILFTHPSQYLYDSVQALKQAIAAL